MKNFLQFLDDRGVETMVQISHIKTIWKQNGNQTSFHMQGDKISEFITVDLPYDMVVQMLIHAEEL